MREQLTPKLHRFAYDLANTGGYLYLFWCPGCKEQHTIPVDRKKPPTPNWSYNGNHNSPTFAPSIRYLPPHPQCHFFIEEGCIRYLSDCDHDLKDKTIPMVEFPPEELCEN